MNHPSVIVCPKTDTFIPILSDRELTIPGTTCIISAENFGSPFCKSKGDKNVF